MRIFATSNRGQRGRTVYRGKNMTPTSGQRQVGDDDVGHRLCLAAARTAPHGCSTSIGATWFANLTIPAFTPPYNEPVRRRLRPDIGTTYPRCDASMPPTAMRVRADPANGKLTSTTAALIARSLARWRALRYPEQWWTNLTAQPKLITPTARARPAKTIKINGVAPVIGLRLPLDHQFDLLPA